MENNTTNAAVKVDSNVTIKTIDSHGKVVKTANIHNKATMHMVTGLLEFLRGAFIPVSTMDNKQEYTTPDEIASYIPVKLRLGTVGVKMSNRASDKPKLTGINSSEFKIPTFADYKLQNDITPYYTNITSQEITFDTVNITNFDDPNNSMGLLLQVKLPGGRLTGFGSGEGREYFTDNIVGETGIGWTYFNTFKNKYEAIFTELGLVSDSGNLLARVLLNGKTTVDSEGEIIFDDDADDTNPITQADDTSLVIEWRIGIISLGQNDYVISASKTIPQLPEIPNPVNISEKNLLRSYIEGSNMTITVPDGTKIIRHYCFYKMDNVISVVLPKELKTIDIYAFDGVSSLTDIYYKGSKEDWNKNVKVIEEGNTGFIEITKSTDHMHYDYAEEVK